MSAVDTYRIKRVRFFGRKVPILCQNLNGPCPLLAIGNILLLQSNISIHPDLSEISFSELTQLVAGFLLDSNPPHEDERINVNQQTQLDTVIKLLPRLQYGLDVNVRFNSVRGFEFTEEMAAFDMSGVTLLHGWILDPEDKHTGSVIEGMSYNKLVEKLLEFRSLTVEASGPRKQDFDNVGARQNVPSDKSESNDRQEAGSTNIAKTAGEEDAGTQAQLVTKPLQTAQSVGAVVVDDASESLGENAPTPVSRSEEDTGQEGLSSASTITRQQGSGSILHREEGLPTDKSARASSVTSETESDKMATALNEGQVAEEFFRETASQLTYYGLSQLHQEVRERQLCVFFRNNHFSTMFKYEGKLYLLITDLGYARESSVVWEKLDQIDGNTEYADSDFGPSSRCSLASGDPQSDADYMLALALQQEGTSGRPIPRAASSEQSGVSGDEAVAMALHEEERILLEQRLGGRNPAQTVAVGGEGAPSREERDRRRPADSARGNRSENGSSCSIQ
ncbi:unnamed protein product [Ectocarpus sp. 6 AP-2014]